MDSKVIFITGAGRRLGRALSIGLSQAGHKVVATAVDAAELSDLQTLLSKDSLTVICDITHPESCQKAVDEANAKFGRIDVLINNAGVYIEEQFTNATPEQVNAVNNVVVTGTATVTTAVLKVMHAADSGHIISVLDARTLSPIPAFKPTKPYGTVDLAAKIAKKQFTDTLRAELAETGISVTSLFLHWVASDLEVNGDEIAPPGATHPKDVVVDVQKAMIELPTEFEVKASPR